MSERDFHDHHYEHDAARIFGGAIFARVHERAVRDFLRATAAGPRHRVLSLGCGDGSIERRLAPHVGEIVGIDISPVAVERANAAASAMGIGNLSFRVSSADTMALDTRKFDVVAAFAFLHHLDDAAIARTLAAVRRALRPGGVFYSSDPSRRRLVGLFVALVRSTYERYHSPDERELDPEALAGVAQAAGFLPPSIRYTDYFLGPLAWLAPRTPGWVARGLEAVDNAALALPLARRYASSFTLVARTGQ